jgi:hypothetical protein
MQNMQRRDLLAVSVGDFVASAIGEVFGQPTSAPSPSEDCWRASS